MKLGKRKKANQVGKKVKKAKKQSMSFSEFSKSFQSLDNSNYGSWPFVVKATIIALIIIVVAALTYFIPVKKKMEQIQASEREQQSLLETYKGKESKARHLQAYKDQIAQMEVEFKSLLSQLPKETKVPQLVKGINMTGVGSNIEFVKISVLEEVQRELFIEQPIEIIATGSYHQFGAFISELARLPRIMTLHDFSIKNTNDLFEDMPKLEVTINTNTYRSKEIIEDEEADDAETGDAK